MQKPTENPIFTNAAMHACFEQLPLALQENILQSGIPMNSVEDIKAYQADYTEKHSR